MWIGDMVVKCNKHIIWMKKQPRLSFWQIWNMSFGFLGIQFGFALQNANVSRIFETLGAKIDAIPILWVAAPLTGLIIQPIVGYLSDHTWTRLGRRRPYFLAGAILASISLLIMPNSPYLWFAAGMLWIMDATINISMEPFRAFVGDMLPSDQRNKGFAMQSFFIGIGAVVASVLPYIINHVFGISNIDTEGGIPPSVKMSFYIGGAVFLCAVLWTVFSTKEYPPEELKQFEGFAEPQNPKNDKDDFLSSAYFSRRGLWWLFGGICTVALIYLVHIFRETLSFEFEKEIYVLGLILILFGIILLIVSLLVRKKKTNNGFSIVINDLMRMPKTMGQLAVVQFFSWFALFSMWIYTTPSIASYVFGATDTSGQAYNDGADWVGVMFAVYNGFAALVAFLLPVLAKKTSRKITHMICLFAGGLGLLSLLFIRDQYLLLFSMLGVGLAWSGILSMPYAILTGSLPHNKLGTYMGIFNFFIVIPQIIAAVVLGFFVKTIAGGESIYALALGGVSMIIAGFLTLRVNDVDEERQKTEE